MECSSCVLFPSCKIVYSLRDSPGTFADKKNAKPFPHAACISLVLGTNVFKNSLKICEKKCCIFVPKCAKKENSILIIDVTRCSVALADPADLMEAFQLLTSQESQDKLGYKIVRFKNKFEPKSKDTFKNIMVNALVRGEVLCGVFFFVPKFPVDHQLASITVRGCPF